MRLDLLRGTAFLFLLVAGAGGAWSKCPPGQLDINGHCVPVPATAGAGSPRPSTSQPEVYQPSPAPPVATYLPPPYRAAPAPSAALPAARPDRWSGPAGGQIVAARLLLRAADIPPHGVGGYGIVAFTALPTSESSDRLTKVCEAYTHSLPRQQSLPRTVPLRDQMLTVWPIDDPSAPSARADDCAYLTSHYDLFGGQAAIHDADRQGIMLSGRGPYLIAWSPSENRGIPDKIVLVYDLSNYSSQASFDAIFSIWQNAIIANPALWRNGVAPSQKRLIFRDFVDDTSEAFLTALHISR